MKGMDFDNDDVEVIDVENYTPGKVQQFSHQSLIMSSMNKCVEAGCNEMREGYWNNKLDKNGNTLRYYVEDTRKIFVESVDTVEMIMICDFDDEANKSINKLKSDLDKYYQELCDEEKKDWTDSNETIKQTRWKQGIFFRKGYLNTKLPFYQDYIEEQVKVARLIFKELTKLTKRLNWYEEEYLVA